jgi:hypothetical protein
MSDTPKQPRRPRRKFAAEDAMRDTAERAAIDAEIVGAIRAVHARVTVGTGAGYTAEALIALAERLEAIWPKPGDTAADAALEAAATLRSIATTMGGKA